MNDYWGEGKENGGSLFKAILQNIPDVTEKTRYKGFPVLSEKDLYDLRTATIRSHIWSQDYPGINTICYQLYPIDSTATRHNVTTVS
jgi:hypothetical protein